MKLQVFNTDLSFAVIPAGHTHPELKPSYRHALILSQNLPSKDIDDASLRSNLRITLENTFLIRYLPGVVAELFDVSELPDKQLFTLFRLLCQKLGLIT